MLPESRTFRRKQGLRQPMRPSTYSHTCSEHSMITVHGSLVLNWALPHSAGPFQPVPLPPLCCTPSSCTVPRRTAAAALTLLLSALSNQLPLRQAEVQRERDRLKRGGGGLTQMATGKTIFSVVMRGAAATAARRRRRGSARVGAALAASARTVAA
eukprot:364166-Chlamydomonas_euryale.AAC.4